MHRAAGHFFARRKSLFPRLEPWELRQERWVNVDDAAWERLQHWFMQDAHETGESNEFDTCIAQHLQELLFYFRFQARPKSARRQIRIRHTKLSRDVKDRCVTYIGNHDARSRSDIA